MKLTSIEDARSLILREAFPLPVQRRPLAQTLGLVLAEDVIAPYPLPPFDNAGMDGYAIRARDVADASPEQPVKLAIVDTVAAGQISSHRLRPNEAVRIMTGAPIPEGADAVVQAEATSEQGEYVLVREPVKPGRHIRRAGEDVAAGERALLAGTPLGPAEIGLLASLGQAWVSVHRPPTVAIISTGSELVEVDQPLGPGQVHNSNAYTLRALCQQMGLQPDVLGIVPDDYEATKKLFEQGLAHDVLLTTGGVSVGQFDFVKSVQDELGVERRLWGVAVKPGKPLVFGVRGGTLVFGLPGNPVSSMVSFELFVRPALLRLMGHRRNLRPLYKAVVAEDIANTDNRVFVVRVRAWRENGVWHVSSTGAQGSGILRSMVGANGFIFVPPGVGGVKAGETVDFMLLREDLVEP